MNDWRPQTLRELAVRPYKDPIMFYAFWFTSVFGLLSILGLGAAIVQAFGAVKTS